MANTHVGAKPLCEPLLTCCQLNLHEQFQWNLNQNTQIYFQENPFEKAAICLGFNVLTHCGPNRLGHWGYKTASGTFSWVKFFYFDSNFNGPDSLIPSQYEVTIGLGSAWHQTDDKWPLIPKTRSLQMCSCYGATHLTSHTPMGCKWPLLVSVLLWWSTTKIFKQLHFQNQPPEREGGSQNFV